MPGRAGRILLRLVLVASMTAAALVAAEYLARFQFRRAQSSGRAGDFIARRGGGPTYRSNSLGFREREIPHKSPDRYRIVVIGDSFTWGQGVEERDRFSNLLEEFLGPRYEVFNFARPGNNMPEHLEVLEQVLNVAPDFVLLQLYINDFETPSMVRPHAYPLLPASLERRIEGSSLVYDMARTQWTRIQEASGLAESYVHYMERNLRDPNSLNAKEAYGQLRSFFERARGAGVPAGGVLFPAPDALGPNGRSYPFGYLHDGVRRVCADENVGCLDLLPQFSTYRDPRTMWVSPFDAHPNAIAHRKAAMEILQAFSSVWQRHDIRQ
jgi:lysophospholipase L1-like esterase